ncbi:hypothetical protein JCM8097_002452 [Rhodosporidiobolus ruineniae]
MVTASTASWQALGPSSFYRSTSAYSLQTSQLANHDLADHLVAASTSGGPLALLRDTHKPVLVTDASRFTRDKGATVRVYSCAGKLLQTIQWDSPTPLSTFLYLPPPTSSSASSRSSTSASLPPDTLLLLPTHSPTFRLYPLHTHSSLSAPYTEGLIPSAESAGGVVDAKPAFTSEGGTVVVRYANGSFAEVGGFAMAAQEGEEDDQALVEGFPTSSLVAPSRRKKRPAGSAGQLKVTPLAAPTLPPDEIAGAPWAVLVGDEASSTRGLEVVVGTRDGSGRVLRMCEIECVEQQLPNPAPIVALTPSPNNRFLAVLTSKPSSSPSSSSSHSAASQPPYTLTVHTSDLSRVLSSCVLDGDATGEGDQGEWRKRPRQVEWCGDNAVAVAWERTMVIVGPFGETLRYFYSSPVHLTSEIDCVRVVCPTEGCELIEMVPEPTHHTLLPGSLSPSALLLSASHLFHHDRSPRADEYVRSILANGRGELVKAVEECGEAAGREWRGGEAGELLKAAAFGKSFLEAYDPSSFVATTRTLRVLNAVRDAGVGLPLTWEQYHRAPPSALLIPRLLALNQHHLALRLSSFLGLPLTPVVKHWARQLIASSSPSAAGAKGGNVRSDEDVCAEIVEKLRTLSAAPSSAPAARSALLPPSAPSPSPSSPSSPASALNLSPADLSPLALALSRPKLAKLLLAREKRVGKVVPMLVRMGEGEEGLRKAVTGGGRGGRAVDMDLVFAVLLALRRTHTPGDLFRLIERVDASLAPPFSISSSSAAHAAAPPKSGPASRLFELWCRALDSEDGRRLLWDYWYQDDRRVEMGVEGIKESLRETDFGERVAKVRKAQKSFAEDKDAAFEAKMTSDSLRLLVQQQSLESELPSAGPLVGLSVNATIRALVLAGGAVGGPGMDAALKKAEKVKKEFGVGEKRFTYLLLRALVHLRDFSTLATLLRKKSAIGFEPVVDELVKAGAPRQAGQYVDRCEGRNRAELWVRCGEWEAAGRECVRRGERGKLIELKSRAPNNVIHAQLEEMVQEMNQAGM